MSLLRNKEGNGASIKRAKDLLDDRGVDGLVDVCPWFYILAGQELNPPGGPRQTMEIDLSARATGEVVMNVFAFEKSDRNVFPHITIGRTRNCDVFINDLGVSKFHCYVEDVTDDPSGEPRLRIIDAGSRNGTFVSERPVPVRSEGSTLAKSGDNLRIGSLTGALTHVSNLDEICRIFLPEY